jgi:hypothetical protein
VNGGRSDPALVSRLSPLAEALAAAESWEELPGERQMVAALLRWLIAARWLGSASRVAFEVPWRGRRIDLVTVSGRGHLGAFEFKLGGTRRVFEQALYNAISTHRSNVVCGGRPSAKYHELARAQGLGVFLVNGTVQLLQRPLVNHPDSELARRLRRQALLRSAADV